MSGKEVSDEVAEDYLASLESLTTNDRYFINNFTVIAKENTEHADAISKVLVEHIMKAPPNHKLPALYVLDSIAKNIGTPYTLFLGHRLYHTFMNAYSLVDSQVRKKLDEMLKTWKYPVPGSVDSRPVFPVDVTKKIENSLIQAKTAALQQQQQQQRSQQQMLQRIAPSTSTTTWRTPTPPQNARYPPPGAATYGQPTGQASYGQTGPQYSNQAQYPSSQQTVPQYHQPQLSENTDALHQSIAQLIFTARADFVRDPYDSSIQVRLKALLDLQTILREQQVPLHQLQEVREQVTQLQNAAAAATAPAPAPTPSAYVPPPIPAPVAYPPPVPHSYQPPTMSALPSATSLADLLASASRSQQSVAPPPLNSNFPVRQPPTVIVKPDGQPQATPVAGESSLMASLRAAGLIPPKGGTPVNGVPAPASYGASPAVSIPFVQRPPLAETKNGVEPKSASLKLPRPHLIARFFEARPNQCLTCGKRFLATDEGKQKKARHLDWHFRTNQRLADAAKRGQSRSWYVDEMEWIKSRESTEEGGDDSTNGGKDSKTLAAEAAVKNDPKLKFIHVPSDSVLASLPCPICQEKFEMSFKDELQDWVWMDAIKIGSKVYHATCYADLKKDGGSTPLRISTPDSVLGKRKAESASADPSPSKMRRESGE